MQARLSQTKQTGELILNGGVEMKKKNVWNWKSVLSVFLLTMAVLLGGCAPRLRVGDLQHESQTVELGDASAVRVEINYGAGDLKVSGGAEELLEADFSYNVARLKPEVEYTDGVLIVSQPEGDGLPALRGITNFQNEWDLRLNNQVPIELSVDMGAGTSDLQLSNLSLTGLDISLGASKSTIDLSGDWSADLQASIDVGATDITVRLPRDVGVRVEIEAGPTAINTSGLTKDGNVYTNDSYGVSGVTVEITLNAGVGQVYLVVEE